MDTNDKSKTKVAIVTGSSSGIGFESSLLLARNEFFTYATMRNLDKSDRIKELKQKERSPLEVLNRKKKWIAVAIILSCYFRWYIECIFS